MYLPDNLLPAKISVKNLEEGINQAKNLTCLSKIKLNGSFKAHGVRTSQSWVKAQSLHCHTTMQAGVWSIHLPKVAATHYSLYTRQKFSSSS